MTNASLSCGILIMHEHSPPSTNAGCDFINSNTVPGIFGSRKAFQYGADVMIFIYCILSCISDAEGIPAS